MARLTPMTLEQAQAIGEQYAVSVSAVQALAAGSVNSNFRLETAERGPLFLRVYEEQGEAGARAELGLVSELSRLGVPTPVPLCRRDGAYTASHAGRAVGVYPWVDAEILCQARITPAVAAKLGAALAQLHRASARLGSFPAGRFDPSSILGRLEHIERTSSAFAADARELRRRLDAELARPRRHLPEGLIHGDLFKDNVLWQGAEIAALIDFESASRGRFAYDIMVCVHAWCYAEAFRTELVQALLDGYTSVRALELSEVDALLAEGSLAALRFATTRITDFAMRTPAGQEPVRDYRRFILRMAALDAGVLDPIIARLGARARGAQTPPQGEI